MKHEQLLIDRIRTRPRFKLFASVNNQEFTENIRKHLNLNADQFEGTITTASATIWVKSKSKNYFWKPNLSLRAENINENECVIVGIFGPSAAVWTFYMFLYFILGILWMVFFTMSFVDKQLQLEKYDWALFATIGTSILLLATFLGARFGQYKAREQTTVLRNFAMDTTLLIEKNQFSEEI